MEQEEIARLVIQAISSYAAGDIDAMLAKVTDDIEYALYLEETGLPFAGTSAGKENLRGRIQMMHANFDYVLFRLYPGRVVDRTMHNQVEFIYRHRASGQILDGRFRFLQTVSGGSLVSHIAEYHDAARVKAFMRLVGGPSTDNDGESADDAPPFHDHLQRMRELDTPVASATLHNQGADERSEHLDLINRIHEHS